MINKKITNKNKKYVINPIFKDLKYSNEFINDDYWPLKILTQISKLEELRNLDKISQYKDKIILTDNRPSFNFLRQDTKCLNNKYIPKTNYGYKNRKRKFSTLFKKCINLNLFTENLKKKKKIENNFPSNFEEISDQIELKEIGNISSMDRYLLNNTNILNQEELGNETNYIKSTRASTSKFPRSSYEKNFYKPNVKYVKGKMEKTRLINSAKKANIEYKNLINLKLSNKKINSRNILNNSLSNNTKSFISFSKSQLDNKTFNKIRKRKLNYNELYITRNNDNFNYYKCKTSRAEIKISKRLINGIINDGLIIDKYIKLNRLKPKKSQNKIDKESILLKLQEKLKMKNEKKLKQLKKREDLTDEELFSKKLAMVPGFAKKFFRSIYNRILFENRVLNKNEVLTMKTAIEKQYERKRLLLELKKATLQRMRVANDNIITEKDDKILIEEEKKILDYYGDLDGLEWQITKRNILNYGKKYC